MVLERPAKNHPGTDAQRSEQSGHHETIQSTANPTVAACANRKNGEEGWCAEMGSGADGGMGVANVDSGGCIKGLKGLKGLERLKGLKEQRTEKIERVEKIGNVEKIDSLKRLKRVKSLRIQVCLTVRYPQYQHQTKLDHGRAMPS